MASGCVPGEIEEGGQDPDEEVVKVYLIRFIADLPLSWYTGSMIECLEPIISISITLYHHKRHSRLLRTHQVAKDPPYQNVAIVLVKMTY